jgi:nitrite reductase/ring-hydroxylating ferredoxin subunit
MDTERIVLVSQDPVLLRNIVKIVDETDVAFVAIRSIAEMPPDAVPTMIVLHLELAGAVEAIREWKTLWPDCFIAGSILMPTQELWIAAQAAGCDLVANRGALPRLLEQKLAERQKGAGQVKQKELLLAKPVVNPGDGPVGRIPDAPDGSIAIFRIGEEYCAFREVCPHAGHSLSDGDFDPETRIVTCPAHGSRFDVCNGERVRGPADFPVQTYKTVVRGEELYVET